MTGNEMPRRSLVHTTPKMMVVVAAICVIGYGAGQVEATDYYVAINHPNASDSNDGLSLDHPFKTLQRAVQPLSPGDTLFIKEGIYREVLSLGTDGTAANPISVMAYPGDEGSVVVRGSDLVTGWTYDGGDVWSVPWQPLPLINYPPSYPNVDEYARRRELVFVDGQKFEQVLAAADLEAGRFWMDDAAQRMRIYYSGDPNARQVEIAARERGVYARGRTHLKLRGLRVEHVTNELLISAVALGPNVRVEDCIVENNNGAGIGVDSNSEIIRTKSSHNGQIGVGLSGDDSLFDSCETSFNSWRYGNWTCGGVKVVSTGVASGNRFVRHTARHNNGPGIAFDTVGSGNVVEASFFEGNRYEIIFEAAIGPNWIMNNIAVASVGFRPDGGVLKGVGFRVYTSRDTYIYNNTIVLDVEGTGIWIGGGERWGNGLHFYTANTKVFNNIIAVQPNERLVHVAVWGLSADPTILASHRFDNNLYAGDNPHFWLSGPFTLTEWQVAWGWDLHSLSAQPLFCHPASGDYSLLAGSPALEAGQYLSDVIEDVVGHPRPLDSAHDIGAYECPADEGCGSIIFDCDFETGDLSGWTMGS